MRVTTTIAFDRSRCVERVERFVHDLLQADVLAFAVGDVGREDDCDPLA